MSAARWFPAFIMAALVFCASCSHSTSAEISPPVTGPLTTVAVQRTTVRDLSRSIALTAEFIPYQEVDVMSKVAGFVKNINVDIGDHVKAGQVLATLEVPEMTDDLTRAAATIQRSEAQVKRAQGDIERAKAFHEVAHLTYQRLADVARSRPGLVAQQELDDARTKDLAAEAQVEAARSNLIAAEQEIEVNKAERARYQTLYNYAKVVAPFDGIVTTRFANTGSMIQAGTASQTQAMPLVRLSENGLLRLLLPVPESDTPYIHLGQQVDVRVPSLNRSFAGKIARFTGKVTTATRTMETEVDVPNPSFVLIPGMYAEVNLHLEHRPKALAIPVTAVDVTSIDPEVYKIDQDGTVRILQVKLGLETANNVEVTTGLSEGDLVVVGNRAGIKAGDKVVPKLVEINGSAS